MSGSAITSHYKVTKSDKSDVKPGKTVSSSLDQDEPDVDFKKLRDFDMDWKYGPCTGISRLERWERAQKYGHNPPEHIHQLILDHPSDEAYTQCVWNDYHI